MVSNKQNDTTLLISVIIPIYNSEEYLDKTIKSVLDQSIGFEKTTQILMIDDGSTDGSGDIIQRYVSRYPKNIQYIKQKNGGVSKARNTGIKHARGTFVHFLDSDDVISRNFYRESIDFLSQYDSEVDFVASKIKFFDANYGDHYLNSKFKNRRVLDIIKDPESSIFHISSVVIRRDSLEELTFDEKVSVGEDAKFLNTLLIKKKKYGVLSNTSLYYRRRLNESSAISGKLRNKSYYLDTPKLVLEDLLDMWKIDGEPAKYIQYLVMNDIAWKLIEEKEQKVLTKQQEGEYKQKIYLIVEQLDDDVIINNRLLNINQKTFLLRKKYGESYEAGLSFEKGRYHFNGIPLFSILNQSNDTAFVFDFIHDLGNGKYKIEGFTERATISSRDERFLRTSEGDFDLKPVPRAERHKAFLGDQFTDNEAFEATIKLKDEDTITALTRTFTGKEYIAPIYTKQFTGLGSLNKTYKQRGARIFRKNGYVIDVTPNIRANRFKYEARLQLQILRDISPRRATNWLKKNIVNIRPMWLFMSKKAFFWEMAGPFALLGRSGVMSLIDITIRNIHFITSRSKTCPVWLVSDRGTAGGDNGEALFRHIQQNESPDADVYFVISKKSPDFKKLQKIGRVIDINSFRYKRMFLRANKVISSSADYYVYNAFGYRWNHFNDLYSFDFVFLQHGITKDDMSDWLNRFEKNIKLFVTAARPEYESILQYDYYYDEKNVILSGFPRFDLLKNKPVGKLILAPTWRHNLLPESRHDTSGIRAHSPDFVNSAYFNFYNDIMNDTRIVAALKEANMSGEFYLHPAFSRQARDFNENDVFTVKKMPYNYKQAFAEGNMLITDYSSVAFDFAYLKKPVIYTQFDKESLYDSHIYTPGYFSYEDDGLGPVTYTYDDSVNTIIELIKSDCKMNSKYRARVETFFAYTDKNNSHRVYEEITNL